MDEFYALVLALIVVLTILIGILWRFVKHWAIYGNYNPQDRVNFTDIYPRLKTGDILLFVSHVNGFTNVVMTSSYYSHAGMVVCLPSPGDKSADDEVYLSETTLGSDLWKNDRGAVVQSPDHSILVPLIPRLKHYSGAIYLMRLNRKLDPERERIVRERSRTEIPYPKPLHALAALVGIDTSGRARHCEQNVAWILDGAGLAPTDLGGRTLLRAGGLYGCARALAGLPNKELPDGYRYLKPAEVVYDIDVVSLDAIDNGGSYGV